MKKEYSKILIIFILLFVGIMGLTCLPGIAYGPLTMYTPTSDITGYCCLSPRTIQLSNSGSNNGKMYTTFEWNKSSMPTFPIYESTNNGQSWTKVGDINDTQNGLGMLCCPQLFEMPQTIGSLKVGTMICVGCSSLRSYANMYLDMYKSTDLGRTWTFVSRLTSSSGSSDPIWEPFLMVANNKLICYYSDERDSAHSQKLVHQTTTDGVKWSSVVDDVALNDSSLRPGMATIAKMINGNYIMTYEVYGLTNTPCYYKISSNPESWTPTNIGTSLGLTGGSPVIAAMPDGRIILNAYGSANLFVNSKNDCTGSWVSYKTPLPAGYNRWLLPLSNGRLFISRCGDFWSGTRNDITYADMAVNSLSGSYRLVNIKSGKSIGIIESGTADGANVVQWTNKSVADQMWQIVEDNGYKKFVNVNSGGIMGIYTSSTENGAKVVQWSDTGALDQQWSLVSGGSYYKIVNRNSGKCLGVYEASTADGAEIVQWTDNGSTDQQWQLVAN